MNQAFGGAFLIQIALTFLFIYIGVLGFAMNYAKVFSMKNKLIEIVEQYEGFDNSIGSGFQNDLRAAQSKLKYTGAETNQPCVSKGNEVVVNNGDYNLYCVTRVTASNRTEYFKVVLYIQFDIPFINKMPPIPVTGETRYLYNF